MPRQRIQRLVYFLSNFVHLTKTDLNRIFEAEVETIFPKQQPSMGIIEVVHEHYTQIGRQEGLQKGREEGRQEAEAMRRELVTRLIEGGFPDAEIIKLTGATPEFVQAVRKELAQQPKA
jgi:predicted transposase YdaD